MVAQPLGSSPPPSDGQLDAVWRSAALRLTSRGMRLLLTLGVGAVMTSAITARFPLLAAVGIVVSAFACYAALIHPHDSQSTHSRLRRRLAQFASAVAALAALAAGLLMLAALFGGSIEVMRR